MSPSLPLLPLTPLMPRYGSILKHCNPYIRANWKGKAHYPQTFPVLAYGLWSYSRRSTNSTYYIYIYIIYTLGKYRGTDLGLGKGSDSSNLVSTSAICLGYLACIKFHGREVYLSYIAARLTHKEEVTSERTKTWHCRDSRSNNQI